MSDHYGSRFLYSEDLINGDRYLSPKLTISGVYERNTIESVKSPGTFINQRAVKFEGQNKYLGINHNMERIAHVVTGEPFGEKWIGKIVQLEVREILFKGKPTPSIRIMPVKGTLLRPALIMSLGKPIRWGAMS